MPTGSQLARGLIVKIVGASTALSSVVSAIVAGVVSYYSNYYSNAELDKLQRARAAKVDQIVKFSLGNEPLALEINKFIAAVAAGKDTKDNQESLNAELIKQFNDSENLRLMFRSKGFLDDLKKYQDAIADFKKSIRVTKKSEDMPQWVSDFDKVYNARIGLSNELAKQVDVPLKEGGADNS